MALPLAAIQEAGVEAAVAASVPTVTIALAVSEQVPVPATTEYVVVAAGEIIIEEVEAPLLHA